MVTILPDETPAEVLGASVVKLAEATEKLLAGPLKRRTVILLIAESSGVSRGTVDKVLTAAANLKRDYVK